MQRIHDTVDWPINVPAWFIDWTTGLRMYVARRDTVLSSETSLRANLLSKSFARIMSDERQHPGTIGAHARWYHHQRRAVRY